MSSAVGISAARLFLIKDSMKQSPSWKADSSSASQRSSASYGTRKFITTFTRACRFSDQSAAMSSHLSRGLPTGHLPRNFPFNTFSVAPRNNGSVRWRSWLRHCAISRKVAGSVPNGVTGIFHWHKPPGRTMAVGSTQPLAEMRTRNISWG